jgi:hypothetical protein
MTDNVGVRTVVPMADTNGEAGVAGPLKPDDAASSFQNTIAKALFKQNADVRSTVPGYFEVKKVERLRNFNPLDGLSIRSALYGA